MVPLIELRGAVPFGVGMQLDLFWVYVLAILGNMLPVPFIYFFARKILVWGSDKKFIGKFFKFCLEKGEKGGKIAGKGRQRLILRFTFIRRYSSPRYRRLDRYTCGKYARYGL